MGAASCKMLLPRLPTRRATVRFDGPGLMAIYICARVKRLMLYSLMMAEMPPLRTMPASFRFMPGAALPETFFTQVMRRARRSASFARTAGRKISRALSPAPLLAGLAPLKISAVPGVSWRMAYRSGQPNAMAARCRLFTPSLIAEDENKADNATTLLSLEARRAYGSEPCLRRRYAP